MRSSLLPALRCARCGGQALTLTAHAEDTTEVTSGLISCGTCHHAMPIVQGIVDAIQPGAAEIATREAAGNARFIADTSTDFQHDDDWLLRLPYSTYHVPAEKGQDFVGNLERLIRVVGWGPGLRVADVGAGNCWASWRVAATGADVIATDISSVKYHGLASGRVMVDGHGHYFDRVLSEMEHLPFIDQSLDGVLIYGALHHSNDMPRTLAEVHRVLRPGGSALVLHEGVSGLLRNNRFTGIRSVHEIDWQQYDWNEQVFWLHEYLLGARRAGLQSRLVLPPFIEQRLEQHDFSGLLFGRIGRLGAGLWHLPGGRAFLRSRFAIWAASYLVGLPMTAVLRRPVGVTVGHVPSI